MVESLLLFVLQTGISANNEHCADIKIAHAVDSGQDDAAV